MARSLEAKSLESAGTTRSAKASGCSDRPTCSSAASATAGAPPNSSAPAGLKLVRKLQASPEQLIRPIPRFPLLISARLQ